MKNFWIMFAISEATTLTSIFVNHSGLTAEQKQALEAFIVAGNNVAATFNK